MKVKLGQISGTFRENKMNNYFGMVQKKIVILQKKQKKTGNRIGQKLEDIFRKISGKTGILKLLLFSNIFNEFYSSEHFLKNYNL